MVALPDFNVTVSELVVLVPVPVLPNVAVPEVTVQFTNWYPVAGVAVIDVGTP
jgi:hypothetical protein